MEKQIARQRAEITICMIEIHMYFTQLLLKAKSILYLNSKLSTLESKYICEFIYIHIDTIHIQFVSPFRYFYRMSWNFQKELNNSENRLLSKYRIHPKHSSSSSN